MPRWLQPFMGQWNQFTLPFLALLVVSMGCTKQKPTLLHAQPTSSSPNTTCAEQKPLSLPDQPPSTYVIGPNKAANRVVVFIHGIFGDSRSTWHWPNNPERSFFHLIQEDVNCKGKDSPFLGSDIYTFGFPSRFVGASFTIDQAVQNLRERLLADGILSYKQIIFVAHSMGGLIAERFILTYPIEAKKIPLAVLYSTPHEGSELANVGQYVLGNPGLVTMVFGDRNQFLSGHENMWKNAIEQGTIRTRIRCAYETRDTGPVRVVSEKSATRICQGNAMPVDADHIGIVKPVPSGEKRNDDALAFLKNALKEVDLTSGQRLPSTPDEKASLASVVLIDSLDSGSLSQDGQYVDIKVHRNLVEHLSKTGHRVVAPPMSVAFDSVTNRISHRIIIKTEQDLDNLTIHVALTTGDGSIVSSTELTGPSSELKEIYKVLPEAILFGLDVDEQTLQKKNTVKVSTTSIRAYAYYLYAHWVISSGENKSVEAAEMALRKAISLDKNFALASWSLGTLLKDQAREAEGRKFLEDANRIDPDHPRVTFTSPSQQSHPVPALMSAIQASEPQLLEAGFVFRKATSKDYGIEVRSWTVDPSLFDIDLAEQKDSHGSSVSDFLEDASVVLALSGGFFKIDHLKRISPAGVLVLNSRIRNASVDPKLTGVLVRNSAGIKIVKVNELDPLTSYIFALQAGPILVKEGKIDRINKTFNRFNRGAVCLKNHSIVFVTIHGLAGNGLSLYEFADLLAARDIDGGVGCDDAINLDGGPSTQVGMNLGTVKEQVNGLWKIHNAVIVRKK